MFVANEVNPFAVMIICKGRKVAHFDAALRLAQFLHITNIAGLRTNFRQSTNMQCYKKNCSVLGAVSDCNYFSLRRGSLLAIQAD
jgi:hypothetical protein